MGDGGEDAGVVFREAWKMELVDEVAGIVWQWRE